VRIDRRFWQPGRAERRIFLSRFPEGIEQTAEFGAELAQFAPVGGGEALDQRFAAAGEADFHPAAVGDRGLAADELALRQPVHQAYRAVVPQVEALGQFADRDVIAAGKALDRQQGLVLLRLQAGRLRRVLTEVEKTAQGKAQGGEQLVVRFGEASARRGGHAWEVGKMYQTRG